MISLLEETDVVNVGFSGSNTPAAGSTTANIPITIQAGWTAQKTEVRIVGVCWTVFLANAVVPRGYVITQWSFLSSQNIQSMSSGTFYSNRSFQVDGGNQAAFKEVQILNFTANWGMTISVYPNTLNTFDGNDLLTAIGNLYLKCKSLQNI